MVTKSVSVREPESHEVHVSPETYRRSAAQELANPTKFPNMGKVSASPATREDGCKPDNHAWTSPMLADDWYPDRDRRCDCGMMTWGMKLDADLKHHFTAPPRREERSSGSEARADALQAERDALAEAISPKYAKDWPAEQLALLAACHREDSESVDVAEDSGQRDEDYDAVRLAIQTRIKQAEAERDALITRVEGLQEAIGAFTTFFRGRHYGRMPDEVSAALGRLDALLTSSSPETEEQA